jgi:hypothetical protein
MLVRRHAHLLDALLHRHHVLVRQRAQRAAQDHLVRDDVVGIAALRRARRCTGVHVRLWCVSEASVASRMLKASAPRP